MKAANPSHVRAARLTRLDYEALVERGVLGEDNRIEKIRCVGGSPLVIDRV